jgi:hypothetical protein
LQLNQSVFQKDNGCNVLCQIEMKQNKEIKKWVLCPACNNKTRLKLRKNTMLKYFPLFCPKCRQETLINAERWNISIIKEPDA